MNLDSCAWPAERLPEALDALCRFVALPARAVRLVPPSGDVARWLESAAATLGIEVEPVDTPYPDVPSMLRSCPPAIALLEGRALLIVARRRGALRVLTPELSVVAIPLEEASAILRAPQEKEAGPEVDALLGRAGITAGRQREKARANLLSARLGGVHVGRVWLVRLGPGSDARRQSQGMLARLIAVAALYAIQFVFWLVTWWLIGLAALQGRIDWGWLAAWGLLRLTIIPLRVAVSWLSGALAIEAGALLKTRLLAGALRLLPEETRSEGVGRLLGRTIESEAVEQLGIGGAFLGLFGSIELIAASAVLSLGAAGVPHALLLAGSCAVGALFAFRYHRLRDTWTEARLSLTHDQVERIVGHRTRTAQQGREQWHNEEDQALCRYYDASQAMDKAWLLFAACVPRGWLILGVLGLAPAFLAGAETGALAIGLFGVLLAFFALQKVTSSLPLLMGAAISWKRVAPLFNAAARPEIFPPPHLEESAREGPLLDAQDLVFRHRGRAKAVLHGCDLRVAAGDQILLEGPTGNGKSTLGVVLAGLRAPDSGLLLLHGLDRNTLGEHGWRRRIACAPQFHENHILTATFSFNLLMGRQWPPPQKDLDEAEAICRELDLGPLLARMPAGLGQMVGESGWQLSHGERSRLYIARALLQRAELVVLDESFAALDPLTLRRSLECVLARARTLVVIAHP